MRRVKVLIDFKPQASDRELFRSLEDSDKFKRLSNFVRPQLNRAVKLYK